MAENLWCFQCGTSYDDGSEVCGECGVGLVDHPPKAVEAVGTDDQPQMAYELHEWAFESRRMLDQILTNENLDHAWQGATLIILEQDEDAVDEWVDHVETTTLPSLDPDKAHLAVEMDDWADALQTKLTDRLALAGVPSEFDADGDLIIHEEDEETFDAVVEALLEASENDEDPGGEDLDGLATHDLLTTLFEAVGRLARNPRDDNAVHDLLEISERIEGVRTPFGYQTETWKGLVTDAATMRGLLEVESNDEVDDDIAARARALKTRLQSLL